MQHDEVVFVCFYRNMMGHTLVHQSNTSQYADDPSQQHNEEEYDQTDLECLDYISDQR